MSEFSWLIEAPGYNWIGVRKLGRYEFYWTMDHEKALRFRSKNDADLTMMAIHELDPKLFSFAVNLGDAKAVEHVWMES